MYDLLQLKYVRLGQVMSGYLRLCQCTLEGQDMELNNLQIFALFSDDISWICLVRNNVHYLLDKSSRIMKIVRGDIESQGQDIEKKGIRWG